MKELAMFYNFSDERFRKAKFALMPLKIQVKKVEKKDFNQPIGFLAGIKGVEPVAEKFDGDGFDEEMIVMHNFTNKTIDSLIKALNKCGVGRVPLKAVITPTSKDWDSLTLIKALKADHEEMLNIVFPTVFIYMKLPPHYYNQFLRIFSINCATPSLLFDGITISARSRHF